MGMEFSVLKNANVLEMGCITTTELGCIKLLNWTLRNGYDAKFDVTHFYYKCYTYTHTYTHSLKHGNTAGVQCRRCQDPNLSSAASWV
jgi:hypothetical protein